MSVGRIDLDEYGDRSARVTAVKTRGELAEIFEDLPQPHPHLDDSPVKPDAGAAAEPVAKPDGVVTWADRPLAQRLTAAVVPLAWVAGIALFLAAGHIWLWFLLPMAVTAVGRGLWGQDWENERRKRDQSYHQDRRNRRRGHWD